MFPYAPTVEGWLASEDHCQRLLRERTAHYLRGENVPANEETEWKALTFWRHTFLAMVAEEARRAGKA